MNYFCAPFDNANLPAEPPNGPTHTVPQRQVTEGVVVGRGRARCAAGYGVKAQVGLCEFEIDDLDGWRAEA